VGWGGWVGGGWEAIGVLMMIKRVILTHAGILCVSGLDRGASACYRDVLAEFGCCKVSPGPSDCLTAGKWYSGQRASHPRWHSQSRAGTWRHARSLSGRSRRPLQMSNAIFSRACGEWNLAIRLRRTGLKRSVCGHHLGNADRRARDGSYPMRF
jgi:hypothetical protein